jgi:hypothetical protein
MNLSVFAIGHADGDRKQIHFSAKGRLGASNLRLLAVKARKGRSQEKNDCDGASSHDTYAPPQLSVRRHSFGVHVPFRCLRVYLGLLPSVVVRRMNSELLFPLLWDTIGTSDA